jgi:hypothetical protein
MGLLEGLLGFVAGTGFAWLLRRRRPSAPEARSWIRADRGAETPYPVRDPLARDAERAARPI